MKSILIRTLVLSALVALLTTMPAFGQLEYSTGSVFGADTQFTVTLGETVSFAITASDSIDAAIHAFTSQSLEISMRSVTGVESTQMTISGLPPGASLYKSEDDLRNNTLITIDELGTYTWLQDLTGPHSVLFKPEPSTWYLDDPDGWSGGGGGAPGSWDPVEKIAVLTQDVSETIQITGSGITLDCGGYSVDATGQVYGIYINHGSGVTILNADVSGGGYGIYVREGQDHTIESSMVTGSSYGIYSSLSPGLRVSSCTISSLHSAVLFYGFEAPSDNCTVESSDLESRTSNVVWIVQSANCAIESCNITGPVGPIDPYPTSEYGIIARKSAGLRVVNNDVNSDYPIYLKKSLNCDVFNNNFYNFAPPFTDNKSQGSTFNQSIPTGGNYWATWSGPDSNGDGFVDVPYDLGNGLADNLPYTTPNGWAKVAVSGTVSSDCIGPMAGITVALDTGADYLTVLTDEGGGYLFEGLDVGSEVEVTCILPLGFHAVSPMDGDVILTMTQNETVDFVLGCVASSGAARGKGYWKHQANVFVKGRGHAHEAEEDMRTNFPVAIFSHFHDNELNGVAVDGVTYMDEGGHVPLELATIQATLTVSGGQNMLDRAKQHYLTLLLNLASEKILTFTEVSEDGRTASEALQFVAMLINDGDPGNDELAKDISEAMNEAQMLDPGVIPEDFTYIAYRPGMGGLPQGIQLAQNAPNPFNPMTKIAFTLPSEQGVQIRIYALNGRRVATLVDEVMPQGRHEVVWKGLNDHGRPVASGTYFYRLDANDFFETKRMVLLK